MPFGLTSVDICFILITLILSIRAAIKGFIDDFFGLGTFIFGAYLAYFFMPKLSPYLEACMNPTIAKILSFLLIFIIIFLVVKIIQLALKSVFSGSILKSLDHGLGFLFGIAEGFFVIVLIFIVLDALSTWFSFPIIKESLFYKYFNVFINSTSSKLLESA